MSMAVTVAQHRPVSQPVSRLVFAIGQLQAEFPLLARLAAPSVAPVELVLWCKSYRDAVRACWELRRVKRMTKAQLSAEAELTPQHVSDYLAADDLPRRRDLPGDKVAAFEAVCGNTLVSQWIARASGLTVLEEMQARRSA